MRCALTVLLLLVSLALAPVRAGPTTAAEAPVIVLRIDGAIGPASADYAQRGLQRAEREHAALVVLQLDTPGGLDTSMRAIIKAMLASSVPVAVHVWPNGARAASAGTYIVYASHIAAAPGGGGNWGGSFLAVPKQSKHAKEAAELVKFLTNPAGQIASFKSKGNLPSSPQALADPAVKAAVNEYFTNAPTGDIFAKGALDLKPVYLGGKNAPVRTAVENALRTVEQGTKSSADGWKAAVEDGKKAAQ